MPDFEKMHFEQFHVVTSCIAQLDEVSETLKALQRRQEDAYSSDSPPPIQLLPKDTAKED